MTDRPAFVLLEDGAWFSGTTSRPIDPAFGEVVFTTNLTGYQETFTDPSYLGQIVVMTAPMIGNYGVNPDDMESDHPQVSGVVVRELSRHPSNWRATMSLDQWLAAAGVPVVEGVDTRRLTRHLRERGAMRGVVAEGREPSRELTAQLLASPSMEGLDLASRASVRDAWTLGEGPRVVAYDYGMKRNIVRMLVAAGCEVTVVPADTSAAQVRELNPDGLFLSNGQEIPRRWTTPSATCGGGGRRRSASRAINSWDWPSVAAPRLPTATAGGTTRCAICAPATSSSPRKTMASRWLAMRRGCRARRASR
jgi:carbamoyl-phosphate synthase small subunit